MNARLIRWLVVGGLWSYAVAINEATFAVPPVPEKSPVSPEDSLKYFQLDPDWTIELAAAEPQVVDPIAIRFDDAGRMWVVEMRDYPLGPPNGEQPLSKIKILTDKDRDGRYETAAVFAEHLLFPTGLQPWNGGVIVTMSGRVAFLKDTDGDGRADVNETWFTGFAEENSQLRANHPQWMKDGWVYVANGLRGGTIMDARTPDAKPVSISGRDFRFRPDTGEYEAITGAGQFGMTFDANGNRFVCSNRNPLVQVVLEEKYAKKNPLYAVPTVVQDVAASGEKSRVFPLTRAWTTSNLHAGQFTAACGVKIHYVADTSFPSGIRYSSNAFICEPTGSLVHHEVLSTDGIGFTSKSPYENAEFLASTDEWFRPVNTEIGPDGAMYVVDMYRAVIEHPQFVPEELKSRPDQRWGDDRGRIYRVVHRDKKSKEILPVKRGVELNRAPFGTQLAKLDDLETKMIEPAVRRQHFEIMLADSSESAAFNFLLAAAPLTESEIPEISELFLKHFDHVWLTRAMLIAVGNRGDLFLESMARDPRKLGITQTKDQLQELQSIADLVRLALADKQNDRALITVVKALAKMDRDVQEILNAMPIRVTAVELNAGGNLAPLPPKSPAPQSKPKDAAPNENEARPSQNHVLLVPPHSNAARAGLLALHQTLAKQGTTLSKRTKSLNLEASLAVLDALIKTEREHLARSPHPYRRAEAIDLLSFDEASAEAIGKMAFDEPSQMLRTRAIGALARIGSPDVWKKLLARFPNESPSIRRAIMDGVLANKDRTVALLDEIEAKRVKVGELDRLQVDRLLKHSDAAIKERSQKLLASAIPADRVKVLTDYQSALALKGEASRGREVFAKNCAQCHRIGELGVNVAPDISDSRVKQPAQYLTDILQPNRAIDNNYISYIVTTTDGRVLNGILATETSGSITLRQAENKTVSLLRSEIDEMRSTGLSLMPEGLEKNVPPQAMADLISFLKNWRYLDGKTPFERK